MRLLTVAAVVALFSFTGAAATPVGSLQTFAAKSLLTHRIRTPLAETVHTNTDTVGRYIVRFRAAPVPLYKGGIAGLRATSPHVTGARHLDVYSPRVRSYVSYLKSRHAKFLNKVDIELGRKLKPHFQYSYALNGMSVSLTRSEAAKLARLPRVLSVQPVQYYRPSATITVPATAADTASSRAWIGAPAVWADPTFNDQDNEGEGVVVADVDTGINSGNSSFAATGPKDGYVTRDPLGSGKYLGVCDPSNSDQSAKKPAFFSCNDKLIGAYTYTSGTHDPDSPEDSEGHGSHTASTAAGNFVDVNLSSLGITVPISGVAPHANIIAYDVCDPTDLCGSDASVSAIDQAIKDQAALKAADPAGFKGMVLNYSIGGGDDPYNDPVEQAFLSAVAAGIYVSTAGGNGGPGNAYLNDPSQIYPVEHLGPWVTSIAASTHDGSLNGNNVTGFTGGDATTLADVPGTITGQGETGALPLSNVVYAGDGNHDYSPYPGSFSSTDTYTLSGEPYADPGRFTAAQAAAECLYPFPAGTFAVNTLVVCDRGDIPLVDKADNVKQGGAEGIVIISQPGNDLISEPYEIPGTMIANADGLKLEAWLKASVGVTPAAQASLTGATKVSDASQADQIADFSSRGPNNNVFDSIIKPDITAPGVSVLAAVSDPAYTDGGSNQPENYAFFDGTSMATPHDTGAGALLMQLHPDWTPAEIKSALMLTAVTSDLIDQCASLDNSNTCIPGTTVPSPQVRGAGRIDVDAASRSGIVMDVAASEYSAANPAIGGDLTKLNLASLGNNGCSLKCTWTRTLISALKNTTVQYNASVSDADTGLNVTVSPTSFSLAPGATETLTVTADVSGLPYKQWVFAQVDIKSSNDGDDGQPVPVMHMPLAVEPQAPEPSMSVSPASLSMSVKQSQTITQKLTINNSGQANLNWAFTTSSALATDVWDQPDAGSGNGAPSGFFTLDGHGVYSADHFVMPVNGEVTKITADGFAQDGSGPVDLTTASAIDWYIYANYNGHPIGEPDDGQQSYLWHYRTIPTGAGLDTSGGNITLDLTAAGQPAVSLQASTYWLIVAPTFDAKITDQNGAAWYWLEGTSADGQHDALRIDPSNAFGNGMGWEALGDSLSFTLGGTLDCSSGSLSGLSFSEQSGTIQAGDSEDVTATFDASSADAGNHTADLCLTGNDPQHALISVPVTVAVTAPTTPDGGGSASSGGGSGGLGLFVLLGLGLAGWRRRSRS